jgi:hypothetical protein
LEKAEYEGEWENDKRNGKFNVINFKSKRKQEREFFFIW